MVNVRRPLPPPPNPDGQSSIHSSKKPTLAVTGTKTDRLCAICLGKLEPGTAITFCLCGKIFHIKCISELRECPLCNFSIVIQHDLPFSNTKEDDERVNDERQENDIIEIVYQCPVCELYVPENSEKCTCGAIFDLEEEEF